MKPLSLIPSDSFKVGNIRFQALHIPGHTLEKSGACEPIVFLSGDFLFVGDAGRPELPETTSGIAGAAEEGAQHLYSSLRRIANLPCHVEILPTHGPSGVSGKSLGTVHSSTAGYEIRFNPTWKLATEGPAEAFVDFILCNQSKPPSYAARMRLVAVFMLAKNLSPR